MSRKRENRDLTPSLIAVLALGGVAAIAQHHPAVMPAWDALKADADTALTLERLSAERRDARLHDAGAVLVARSEET